MLKDLIVNFKLFLVALFLEFWRWWSRGLQFLLAAFRSLVNSLFKVENPTLSSALMAVKLFARFTSDSDGIVRNKIENLRSEMDTLQPTDFIYTTTKELISAIPARLCSCQQEIISILCHCHLKPCSTECKKNDSYLTLSTSHECQYKSFGNKLNHLHRTAKRDFYVQKLTWLANLTLRTRGESSMR